ncbi:GerA spore germination protein [Evansella caseinilytica]|uniref:GerA spore germination protein n=1 Tax=Evansella caseinilytica TaxID=1503961 RepID=A0A1H3U772_9BACI|nr:spore germination protein [Evansella caseinilytica]SDZ58137.1 GerA spore germination protein [Evansella caseinilytica]
MDAILSEITNKFAENEDFFIERSELLDVPVFFLGFHSLIDLTKTKTNIQRNINHTIATKASLEDCLTLLGEEKNVEDAALSILEGKLIICLEVDSKCIVTAPVSKPLNRSIEPPTNENVLLGSLNSFTEELEANLGLVRKQILSEHLRSKSFTVGRTQKKKLSLLYLEDSTDRKLVQQVIKRIEANQEKAIQNIQSLAKALGFSSWGIVSKFNITELPQEAVFYLKKGRVVLFLDQFPAALILPKLLWDMFVLESDNNHPAPMMIALRLLRIFGALITLILPGLYVALVAINPEILQIELALSIAKSREGVPYPAFVEIIIMLIVLELILEASARLPKTIGPTITMVGGIILGQAVVEAKLVSNLLIIILAATTIATSTVIGFQNLLTIRLCKYAMVILASIFGVLGIISGLVLISAYLASIKSFSIPFLHIQSTKDEADHG